MNVISKSTQALIFLFLLCGGLYVAKGFLVPITFAALIAMLFVPLCEWFENKGMGKVLAAMLCVLLFIGMGSGIVALLSWQVAGIAQDADHIADQLSKIPAGIQEFIHKTVGLTVEQQQQMLKEQDFSTRIGGKIASAANSAASMLGMSLLVIVYIFMFIYYRSHLENFILKLVSDDNREKTKRIMYSSGRVAQQYISGMGMMIGILWIMYGVGFSIIGIRHALFFAVLCGLLEMMPYVGNLIGNILTALMAYTQGGSTMALWVLAVYGVVQFTQSYLLEPLVVGARVSINPLCTIVVVILGEMIWGIPGMVLAIPLLGIVKIVCDNVSWLRPFGFLIGEVKHREKKKYSSNKRQLLKLFPTYLYIEQYISLKLCGIFAPENHMDKPLSFFNWSLKKVQSTEPDSYARARVRIIYAILLFSILKTFVVIGFGGAAGQWLQVTRAVIACVIYVVLVKVLLYKPVYLKGLTHVMIMVGVLVVWTNIFVYSHKINLVTVQFVYMIALSSFFVLGSGYGIFYAVTGILPVVLFLFFHGNGGIYAPGAPQEFVSPGFEIIVILNFISLVVSHYLFFEAINVNISEKEKLNRQLQSSIAEANELAESKSNFLSTMSHELRTPLNSVVGISELLLEDKPEERQKENLTILQFSALDLLSLINNILDFNKIDSDKLALEQVPVRLAEFMQNICAVLRIKANNKHLQLRLEMDEGVKKTNVITDPIRLSQVMYNLIGNAIKFTEKGSVTVKLSLVTKTDSEAEVLFSIADTGIGIHSDKHEQIFELFTQAESHLTRKHEGTGLGLAIVKKILALFGSRIELESSQGRGWRFFFAIPFVIATEDAGINTPTAGEKADLSHLRILIAEDNDVNRMILMKQMDKLNVKPVIVENGEDAYEAFIAGDFDLIFLDLHMPVSDGYQAIKQIRALPAPKGDVHIIAFTASVTEQQKIVDAGFDDYLYKPVNMSDLREKLEKIDARNKV